GCAEPVRQSVRRWDRGPVWGLSGRRGPAVERGSREQLRGLAAGRGLGNEGGRAQALGDESPLEAGSHLVDEGRRDGRVAALVLGRAREDERALGHGERQEEEERVLEARLACRPETSGERESRGARAELRPQRARRERV